MHPRLRTALLPFALLAGACASASPEAQVARRDRDVLTAEEIEEVPSLSAYEVVRRLRPAWLQDRGAASVVGSIDRLPSLIVNGSPMFFKKPLYWESELSWSKIPREYFSDKRAIFFFRSVIWTMYNTGQKPIKKPFDSFLLLNENIHQNRR